MRKVEKRLRERLKAAEKELSEVKADRERYRNFFKAKFKWFLEIHGKNQTANTEYMVQQFAEFFTRVDSFWW